MSTPLYQTHSHLQENDTTLISSSLLSSHDSAIQSLFKALPERPEERWILETESTIFHPQGGGQPSDIGTFTFIRPNSDENQKQKQAFTVELCRKSGAKVLHCGYFTTTHPSPPTATAIATATAKVKGDSKAPEPNEVPAQGTNLHQQINSRLRALHSRIHTAGHILSLALHSIPEIPTVKDGKAQHFPSSAFVEFEGTVDSIHKDAIEAKTNELVAQGRKVLVHEWSAAEAKERCAGGVEGMAVDVSSGDDVKVRVVEIEGLGSYPCGGTHLPLSSDVGPVRVLKIGRKKGISKVGYELAD